MNNLQNTSPEKAGENQNEPSQQSSKPSCKPRESEQEKAGWNNPWPEDGEQCPECGHGLIEVQEFGQGAGLEVWASCVGLIGCTQEDAEEDEEGAGCGWSGRYFPNVKLTDSYGGKQ
jgi:hypothetical protein